ncbi:uncharacterized protein LOC135494283 [Lineus longissimus]|uniref:uncharacterized protein LOC135494283 n=1 Tax=Lineus longissimus TaxID=88925 RepID=UPI00315D7E4A
MASNSKDKLYHCEMCDMDFKKITFSRHKLLYYDFENNAWKHHEVSRFNARAGFLPKLTRHRAAGYNPFEDISSSSDSDDSVHVSVASQFEDDALNAVEGDGLDDLNKVAAAAVPAADHIIDHDDFMEFVSDEDVDEVSSTAGEDDRCEQDEGLSESEDEEVVEDSDEELEDFRILPANNTGTRKSKCEFVNTLLFYVVYFISYWQASVNVSDNAVEWLLQFHFQLFSFIGCNVDHRYLSEFAVLFPTSMYMLRQLAEIDRDDVTRGMEFQIFAMNGRIMLILTPR